VWTILAKALSLVIIVGIGFGMKRLRWVKAEDFSMLSKIVLRVTLPCALATSFNQFEIVPSLLGLTLLAFLANIVQQAVGYVQHRHGTPVQRAFGILHGGSYNIGALPSRTCRRSSDRSPSCTRRCSTWATPSPPLVSAGAPPMPSHVRR